MREFYSAPLEVKREFTGDFQTHPYECGWAGEAIFFISVEEICGDQAALHASVQVSSDGILWADEGTCFPPISGKGLYFTRVKHFGGWLRLNCSIAG